VRQFGTAVIEGSKLLARSPHSRARRSKIVPTVMCHCDPPIGHFLRHSKSDRRAPNQSCMGSGEALGRHALCLRRTDRPDIAGIRSPRPADSTGRASYVPSAVCRKRRGTGLGRFCAVELLARLRRTERAVLRAISQKLVASSSTGSPKPWLVSAGRWPAHIDGSTRVVAVILLPGATPARLRQGRSSGWAIDCYLIHCPRERADEGEERVFSRTCAQSGG